MYCNSSWLSLFTPCLSIARRLESHRGVVIVITTIRSPRNSTWSYDHLVISTTIPCGIPKDSALEFSKCPHFVGFSFSGTFAYMCVCVYVEKNEEKTARVIEGSTEESSIVASSSESLRERPVVFVYVFTVPLSW